MSSGTKRRKVREPEDTTEDASICEEGMEVDKLKGPAQIFCSHAADCARKVITLHPSIKFALDVYDEDELHKYVLVWRDLNAQWWASNQLPPDYMSIQSSIASRLDQE